MSDSWEERLKRVTDLMKEEGVAIRVLPVPLPYGTLQPRVEFVDAKEPKGPEAPTDTEG